ncbi:TolC family protein [Pseudenhygromyxa sp. WMMC2535]|uniref:TolC family protein n=1 Tax=Pseudenhygromyxa sp. WMMC2535 TaxID=2712867 RepID=UPI0015575A6C
MKAQRGARALALGTGLLLALVGATASATPPTGVPPEKNARDQGPPAPSFDPEVSRDRKGVDNFRRSDPREAALSPVAESSGLSAETAAQERGEVLTLAEVIAALDLHDPRLEAADRKREAAEGKLLSARGGFDSKLKMRGLVQPLGYYTHGVADLRIEQPTPLWGLGVWAGWRVGLGDFAVYDGKLLTAAGGELRAGVSVPLLRDGPIDRTRADIRQARIEVARTGSLRDAKRLELEAKAAEAYWSWVVAGLVLDIERQLLAIALERDAGLRRQIDLGNREGIIGVDNRRLVLDREGRIVGAERQFQAAALALSLYLRDERGAPLLAGADRLPQRFPAPEAPALIDLEAELAAALERRPDLAATLDTREQAEIELRWAKNQRNPRIDLSSWVAKDLGPGPEDKLPVEVAAVVELELPIPLRKARGQYQRARAELAQVDAELRFARDRVAVDVLDAHSALAAAYQRARLADEQLELAHDLADAELRRFELGDGDLLLVNLRELAVAQAASDEVEALGRYFTARAALEVATGLGVQPVSIE